MKALENPRRSIHGYGTVGCTKDPVGRGKRLIIVDCIIKDRPVPGAFWTLSTQTTSKKVKKKMIFRRLKVLLLTKRPGKCKRFKNRMTIWKKIYGLQPQLRINGKKKVVIWFLSTKVKKMRCRSEMKNMRKKLVFYKISIITTTSTPRVTRSISKTSVNS